MRLILPVLFSILTINALAADPVKSFRDSDPAYVCKAISDRAYRQKVKVLVIGIEGFLQIDSQAVENLYDYRLQRRAGKNPTFPKFNPSGVMGESAVTKGLLFPLMQKHSNEAETLVFGESTIVRGAPSVAEACAVAWMKVPGRKLIIAGHSFGGPAALDLALNLKRANVNVDAVFLIDAVERNSLFKMREAQNVDSYINFRQEGANPGARLGFANDRRLLDTKSRDVGHMNIPGHPEVIKAVSAKVSELSGKRKSEPKVGAPMQILPPKYQR